MAGNLIRLSDGTLVEIETPPSQLQQVSGGAAKTVSGRLDQIEDLLVSVATPVSAAWEALESQHLSVTEFQVEVGIAFEGEGSIYVAKLKGSESIKVTLKLANPQSRP